MILEFRLSYLLLPSICFLIAACQKEKPVPKTAPIPVTVTTINPKDIPAVYEYIGVVQSSHEVEIRARVIGYLEEIAYIEGSFVNKGDLLFQLAQGLFKQFWQRIERR